MKTDEEILREGRVIAGYSHSKLILFNGQVYPFLGVKMLNPLDPTVLLCSICRADENQGSAEVVYWARCICNTVQEACRIRCSGYSIVTRYKSGAPRVVLDSVTNNVIILGELCSKKGLILPILSTQLADSEYRQENVDAWRVREFSAPPRYNFDYSKNSWENNESGPDYNWKRRTIETWSNEVEKFSIIREETRSTNANVTEREYFRREESDED